MKQRYIYIRVDRNIYKKWIDMLFKFMLPANDKLHGSVVLLGNGYFKISVFYLQQGKLCPSHKYQMTNTFVAERLNTGLKSVNMNGSPYITHSAVYILLLVL